MEQIEDHAVFGRSREYCRVQWNRVGVRKVAVSLLKFAASKVGRRLMPYMTYDVVKSSSLTPELERLSSCTGVYEQDSIANFSPGMSR
jgi:hypothetical protein